MMDKHCGNCIYCGEVLKDNLHSCNNDKSIFKACLESATGCENFEPQESEEISERNMKMWEELFKADRSDKG